LIISIPKIKEIDFCLKIRSKTNQDDLIEFNENDCTAPRIIRKQTKPKKKTNAKQTTMYDYASSISYKHKQFYSSLDNTTTTKMIIKGQKRSLTVKQIPIVNLLMNIFFLYKGLSTIIIIIEFQKKENN
jgi:hypothetical protein